jgi:hypothetical protein
MFVVYNQKIIVNQKNWIVPLLKYSSDLFLALYNDALSTNHVYTSSTKMSTSE